MTAGFSELMGFPYRFFKPQRALYFTYVTHLCTCNYVRSCVPMLESVFQSYNLCFNKVHYCTTLVYHYLQGGPYTARGTICGNYAWSGGPSVAAVHGPGRKVTARAIYGVTSGTYTVNLTIEYPRDVFYEHFTFACFVCNGSAPIPYVKVAVLNLPHP